MPRKCKTKTKTKTKIKKRKPKFLSLRHLNLNHTPAEAEGEEETTAADFFAAAVDGCSATLAALFGSGSPSDDTCAADGTAAQVSMTRSPSLTCTKDPAHDSKAWSPALTCTGGLVQDSETWLPSLTCARDMAQDSELLSPSLTCVRDMAQESEMLSPSLTRVRDMAQDSEMLSPSLTCTGRDIFRGAMRGSEGREEREEKWVCYEEVTSCAAEDVRVKVHSRGLSLKLDYQEIIDAWCDKGSLYMPGPQTVPDLCDDFLSYGNGLNDGLRSNGSLWTVPENTVGKEGVKEEHGLVEELKIRHREASLLRYKEKRQNRLFSKRIRYEVRKINAEKRPRMKGRFVKRN